MKRSAPLLLPVLLAGCVGPKPPLPTASVVVPPTAWRYQGGVAGPTSPTWWREFGDPVLSDLVERALANNVDVAIAAARVEEARAQFRLATASRLPELNATAAGAAERTLSPFGKGEEQRAGQASLAARFDLDLFGRLRDASEAARAELLATDGARDVVGLAVVGAVTTGYVSLRTADAKLTILRNTLASREASLRFARRRWEAGYGTALDLRQAEAEYHATEQSIPTVLAAISRHENALALLLGETPHGIDRGRDLTALAIPTAPAALPAALLRQRPDIYEAENRLVAADHSLDAARAAFMPDVSLSANRGAVASTLLTSPVGIWSFGGGILAPLFEGGRLRGQRDAAAARRTEAAFTYRKAALTAFRDVEDALSAETQNAQRELALSRQRDALASALSLATNRYREGYSPFLEQLDAQRNLLAADLTLADVRADRLTTAIALFEALGGGWTKPDRQNPG